MERTGLSELGLDVERFVEWRGLVKNLDGDVTSICYGAGGEDFYFPFVDEDDKSSGSIYRKPRVERAPYRQESKIMDSDEGSDLKVPQYQIIVSECIDLEGIREVYHFTIYYRTYCPKAC